MHLCLSVLSLMQFMQSPALIDTSKTFLSAGIFEHGVLVLVDRGYLPQDKARNDCHSSSTHVKPGIQCSWIKPSQSSFSQAMSPLRRPTSFHKCAQQCARVCLKTDAQSYTIQIQISYNPSHPWCNDFYSDE